MEMDKTIRDFIETLKSGETEVYNEFSLQHELGIFLREKLPGKKVKFEWNVKRIFEDKTNEEINQEFLKKEIDITVFEKDKKIPCCAVELKFPRNGQYPEQMYSFCRDIRFAEQLREYGVSETFVLILVDDALFYSWPKEKKGTSDKKIYEYFRGQEKDNVRIVSEKLSGRIKKPTGEDASEKEVTLTGKYHVKWHPLCNIKSVDGKGNNPLYYCLLKASK
jgi:hypothetical protein